MIIPVITCFDNNYCAPAAVCFYSLLENANKNYTYAIYVLHNDITEENKQKLESTIADFTNCSLEFISMNNRFQSLFNNFNIENHYSKEMFYKFCISTLFPQYEKCIITDVDVVFLGDISKEYIEIKLQNSYIGAFKCFRLKNSINDNCIKMYETNFSETELQAIQYSAGYYICNLKKMREENIESRFIEFAKANIKRLHQPEQDTINIICYPYIEQLNSNSVVCTYLYDIYKTEDDFYNDLNYSAEEIKFAMKNPIQLHYATCIKPWNMPDCTKSDIFFKFLSRTPYFSEVFQSIKKQIIRNTVFKVKLFNKIAILKITQGTCYLLNFIKIGRLEIRK